MRRAALLRLQGSLGYRFADAGLLQQALRHRSAAHEQGAPSFERLEFLGDAALSHAVGALLFARWPEASEGELTRARAALVREGSLAAMARRLDLPDALEVGGGLGATAPGAAVLADAMEAVLGALLLDGGWRAFKSAVGRLFAGALADLDPEQLALEEPKSTLQEFAQKRGMPLPVYREVEVLGPAHRQRFVYEVELGGRSLARGEGPSKKAAQQEAARRALVAIEGFSEPR